MPNFKQICKIRTNYYSKAPELELRENESGKNLVGKIQWFDDKDKEGKQLYTWFNFFTSKPEFMEKILQNPSATFEVEGFLKNRNWKDKRTNEWKNRCEVLLSKVEVYNSQKSQAHFQERDEEIPF